jgi:uncharacterized protein (TIGR02757 family)
MLVSGKLKDQLDRFAAHYEQPEFIEEDPICIPHRYTDSRDIEIAGFFAAIFAWGQRKTIINKAATLLELMDNQPYRFITQFEDQDLQRFKSFRHRTFQPDDAISFMHFLQSFYREYQSLEDLFVKEEKGKVVEHGLVKLYNHFINHPAVLKRSRKHLSSPSKGSACKRLNMFLRWMVRSSSKGVDFGIWKRIPKSELIIPLDVHVLRTALKLGLVKDGKPNWKMAIELTETLKGFDKLDPVKYDFVLFNMSLQQRSMDDIM